jgi:hypothetical protein
VKALVASSTAVLLGVAVTFGSVALYCWRSDRRAPGRGRNPVPVPRAGAGVG